MRGILPRTIATSSQRCSRGHIWQSLKILSGKFCLVFHRPKAIFEEEVRNARKQAHGLNSVLLRFFNQRPKNAAARALALCFRLHHDRAHFAEMRPIKVERPAAKEYPAV